MRRTLTATGVLVALLTGVLAPVATSVPVSASARLVASSPSMWQVRLESTGSTTFSDVSCPTSRICIAVGGGATGRAMVYRTANGGASWSRQIVPDDTPGLIAVSCPSPSRCTAAGNGPYQPVFVTTTNGGATWSTLIATGLYPYYVYGLDCPSLTTCYAALQGGLAISVDGGTSWTQLSWSNSLSVLDLSCPSTRTCFVIAVNAVNGAPSTSLVLQRYRDAGSSIATVKSLVTSGASAASISCPSSTSCMAVGAAGDRSTVLSTTTGGTSWAVHQLPANVGPAVADRCKGAGNCVVAAASPNDRGLVAATTTSDGRSWVVHRIGAASDPTGSGGGISCSALATCALVGYGTPASTLYVSQASTGTWARHRLPAGSAPLTSVACPTAGTCVAVGVGVAVQSLDGGASWMSAALPPPNTAALQAVACPAVSTCAAVGKWVSASGVPQGALAYYSTDSGRTWHASRVPSGDLSLDSISCPTSTTCVATSSDGHGDVLRSTTSGRSWVKVALPGGLASHQVLLNSVSCGEAASCVAVGAGPQGPAVERSTDAGATWMSVAQVSGLGSYLQSVSCTSASDCWAAGGVQEIAPLTYSTGVFATTDGGSTWTSATSPTSDDVTSIACQDTVCEELSNLPGNYAPSTSTLETSLDGGVTWTASSLPVPSVLASVSAAPASGWVLVGGDAANGALVLTGP
jgi:hypothetical protein